MKTSPKHELKKLDIALEVLHALNAFEFGHSKQP